MVFINIQKTANQLWLWLTIGHSLGSVRVI